MRLLRTRRAGRRRAEISAWHERMAAVDADIDSRESAAIAQQSGTQTQS